MAYENFKDLPRRIASDKTLRDKAFNIAKNPKYDGYQRGLASMFYKFVDKKSSNTHAQSETLGTPNKFASGTAKSEILPNQEVAKVLQNQLLESFKNEKYTHLLNTIFEILILHICN